MVVDLRKRSTLATLVSGTLVVATGGLLRSSVGPGIKSERLTFEELESLYEEAVGDATKRASFVETLRDSIDVPEYVTDIVYAGAAPAKDNEDESHTLMSAPTQPTTYKNGKLTRARSKIEIFDRVFSQEKSTAKTFGDFMSILTEHEFRHAEIAYNRGDPIVGYCIMRNGALDITTLNILNELEAYGAQVRKHINVKANGLSSSKMISKPFAEGILTSYRKNFRRLGEMQKYDHLKDGVFNQLLEQYNLPHMVHVTTRK
jgi:predicted RNA-binding protein with PIN domain